MHSRGRGRVMVVISVRLGRVAVRAARVRYAGGRDGDVDPVMVMVTWQIWGC
jgi:hypothetical protein